MRVPIYQVDAFTSELYQGNPAAVCLLSSWLADSELQQIAAENNLSETAFLVEEDGQYHLRWFTPTTEVRLCGHATLATAHVLFNELGHQENCLSFETRSGELLVSRKGDRFSLDLPACYSTPESAQLPMEELLGVNVASVELFVAREDLLVMLPYACNVALVRPNYARLAELPSRGVIVPAEAEEGGDFVSRFFAPGVGINEDPVTGSAHCQLAPFWQQRLGKDRLVGRQISPRGGVIECEVKDGRVILIGQCVTYLEGEIRLESPNDA